MQQSEKTFGFVVGELGKGGQEQQLINLVEHMQNTRIQCCVIIWTIYEINNQNVEIIRNAGVKLLLLENESILKKIKLSRYFLKDNKAVSLHSFSYYLNFATWWICVFTKIMPIGGIRAQLKLIRKDYGMLKFWLNGIFPYKLISNNNFYRSGMDSNYNSFAFGKIEVVTNQLDPNQFRFTRSNMGIGIKTASIGRISHEKSLDILINAISLLVQKGYNIRHTHAGTGILKESLDILVVSKNLQDHFLFCGEVEDISEFLKDKYLFIHSSTYEGYPNVIMEAMACGEAIVSTECGDVKLLVEDGVNGFVVPVGDFKELANRIEDLLQNDRLTKKMSNNSRIKSENLFSTFLLLEQTLKAYEEFGIQIN